MAVTVDDLLQLNVLKNAQIVSAFEATGNVIEYVDVLESPEGYKWLKPNLLLLTTVYPLLDNMEEQKKLFRNLHEVGVSAIAIKTKRFIEEIPEFMLRDSQTYQIPIIKLPVDAAFNNLISHISRLLIDEQAELLHQSLAMNHQFLNLVQNGGGLQEIAHLLCAQVNGYIIIEDKDLNIIFYDFPEQLPPHEHQQLLAQNRLLKNNLDAGQDLLNEKILHAASDDSHFHFSIAALTWNKQRVGYITIVGTEPIKSKIIGSISDLALSNAANATSLAIAIREANQEKEQIMKYGIFNDLLYGSTYIKENVETWLDYFGWRANQKYVVVILSPLPKPDWEKSQEASIKIGAEIAQTLSTIIAKLLPKAFVLLQNNDLIIIQEAPPNASFHQSISQAYLDVLTEIKKYSWDIDVRPFVGNPCQSLLDISTSFQQAQTAALIGKKIDSQKPIWFYDEIDTYYLFSKISNRDDLTAFRDKYLAPLLHSGQIKFDLISTLEAYIACGGSLQKASGKLFIHENTLKYRLKRITEVLQHPLNDNSYLFKLYMSIIIHKVIS